MRYFDFNVGAPMTCSLKAIPRQYMRALFQMAHQNMSFDTHVRYPTKVKHGLGHNDRSIAAAHLVDWDTAYGYIAM